MEYSFTVRADRAVVGMALSGCLRASNRVFADSGWMAAA
jgi:hypothetical protein